MKHVYPDTKRPKRLKLSANKKKLWAGDHLSPLRWHQILKFHWWVDDDIIFRYPKVLFIFQKLTKLFKNKNSSNLIASGTYIAYLAVSLGLYIIGCSYIDYVYQFLGLASLRPKLCMKRVYPGTKRPKRLKLSPNKKLVWAGDHLSPLRWHQMLKFHWWVDDDIIFRYPKVLFIFQKLTKLFKNKNSSNLIASGTYIAYLAVSLGLYIIECSYIEYLYQFLGLNTSCSILRKLGNK